MVAYRRTALLPCFSSCWDSSLSFCRVLLSQLFSWLQKISDRKFSESFSLISGDWFGLFRL